MFQTSDLATKIHDCLHLGIMWITLLIISYLCVSFVNRHWDEGGTDVGLDTAVSLILATGLMVIPLKFIS